MAEPSYRMRLLDARLLDRPVVALAVRTAESGHQHSGTAKLGAVKFLGDLVLGTFGANEDQSEMALSDFVDDCAIVAHDLAVTLAFVTDTGVSFDGALWDMQELAEIFIPASADDSLHRLGVRLGVLKEPLVNAEISGSVLKKGAQGCSGPSIESRSIGPEQAAIEDAEITMGVYRALIEQAQGMPSSVLARLGSLLTRAESPLTDLITALIGSAAGVKPGPIGGVSQKEIASRLERPRSLSGLKVKRPLDPDEITRLLAGDGPLAHRFPRYEPRLEQIAMSRAVAEAFGSLQHSGDAHHLMVEGGTGIGKSVAYLLPAVLFAARNKLRVVISTNTINLQEQLVRKDIPDLLEALEDVPGLDLSQFRYTQLKGKANYLCVRRWDALANSEAGSVDDARTIAKTLLWLRETRTGDRSELRLSERELVSWDRLSARTFSTCLGAREGACFYRHARDEATGSHLIVVNHSLLLSDMQVGGSVIPDYDFLIVDEAHNLEAEATRQFGFRVPQVSFENLAERVGDVVDSFGGAVRMSGLDESLRVPIRDRIGEAQQAIGRFKRAWSDLAAGLTSFAVNQRMGRSDDDELLITDALRAQPAWSELDIAGDEFERCAGEISDLADGLWRDMDDAPSGIIPGIAGLQAELSEWFLDQTEARARVRTFVSDPKPSMVYWIGRGVGLTLNGAPLDIGPRLREELFTRKQTVVLTSATMAVNGEFKHLRDRLGIDEPQEVCLGSPFDYRQAALLCLPTDIPDPNDVDYPDAVASVIDRLVSMADGRTMALFTSHAGLRSAAERLRRSSQGTGFDILAQGVDGTPEQLLARFARNHKAVLLGTASFWEGVDIDNEALKVLVVTRLPFNVPTEPIFAARSERYDNAFKDFAVPQAVLRLRQGFGRLIRSKADRGVVVILDSRVTSKHYGSSFLTSLPPATTIQGPFNQVLPSVQDWITKL